MPELNHPRRIRSFVRREGRFSDAQRLALGTLWERYGVNLTDEPLDLNGLFGRSAPHILEIGFGAGEALAAMAQAHPECDYLGVEVYRPGIGKLFQRLEEQRISNVRVICHDAVEVLSRNIPDESLAQVHLYFPDPWPKKRHHKRRIVQPDFVELVRRKLMPGACFYMATDWEPYAGNMMEVMNNAPGYANIIGMGLYAPRHEARPLTKFERRGHSLGHRVWDLAFKRL